MKNVAIYCRLSSEDTDKRNVTDESESIQNQKSMLVAYALERGWTIYEIYVDEDYSGIDRNRPAFNNMLLACENGDVDIVLCKTISRFSRDMEMIEKYIHGKFLEWSIRFIGVADNTDTSTAGNKKARQIYGLINEWYLEDLSDNIKKTFKHKRESGQFMSASAPYGYLRDPNDKHKLIVDDVAANIVREIFDMYKAGSGVISIVKHLNAQSIQTPTAHKLALGIKARNDYNSMWGSGTIRQILRNENYIGNLVQGKRTTVSYKISKTKNVDKNDWARVDNNHEPIIDIETWSAVQRRITSRSRPVIHDGKVHIFAQKVYCAECGAIFVRKNQQLKNGKGYIEYLHCSGCKYGNRICSNKNGLRFDELTNLVTEEINSLIEKYADSDELLNALCFENNIDSKLQSLESELTQLTEQIVKKQGYFKKLYEDNLNGRISDEQFDELNNSFKNDIDLLQTRAKIIEADLTKHNAASQVQVDKRQVLEKYTRIEQLDRIAVDEFIERIEIGIKTEKERNIAIKWVI